MLEKATVIKVNDRTITLTCSDSDSCQACAAHGFCGGVNDKTFDAWNSHDFELEPGNQVEVHLPTGKTIGAAFMVMIFPLLLFVVFFYAAKFVIPGAGEGIQVIGGLAGIAAGFGLNFLINRKPKQSSMPDIVKKLD